MAFGGQWRGEGDTHNSHLSQRNDLVLQIPGNDEVETLGSEEKAWVQSLSANYSACFSVSIYMPGG